MSSAKPYVAAARWRSPKTIGRDMMHMRLLFGNLPDGIGIEEMIRARVLTDDPRATDIEVVYTSGASFLRSVVALLEPAAEAASGGGEG